MERSIPRSSFLIGSTETKVLKDLLTVQRSRLFIFNGVTLLREKDPTDRVDEECKLRGCEW